MSKVSLEEIFLLCLHSNDRLKWFLQHDVNLVSWLDVYHKKYMTFADMTLAFISKEKLRAAVQDMSKEKILKTLQDSRPDLYKTLTTWKNGISWLEKQIHLFKKRFL